MNPISKTGSRPRLFKREGILYLGLTAVLTVSALNTGNNMIYILVAFLLAAVPVSYLLGRLSLSRLETTLDLPEEIFARRPFQARLRVRNGKGSFPSFLLRVILEGSPGRSVWVIPDLCPGETEIESLPLAFPKRGRYHVTVRLECDALGGLWTIASGRRIRREVIVFPALHPFRMEESAQLSVGSLEVQARGTDGTDLYNIREYSGSDEARHIDWKSSAKLRKLMIREYSSGSRPPLLLLVDPSLSDPSREKEMERTIEKAATVAAFLFREEWPYGWDLPGDRSSPSMGRGHLRGFLTALALLESGEVAGRDGEEERGVGRAGPLLRFSEEGVRAVGFGREPVLVFGEGVVGDTRFD